MWRWSRLASSLRATEGAVHARACSCWPGVGARLCAPPHTPRAPDSAWLEPKMGRSREAHGLSWEQRGEHPALTDREAGARAEPEPVTASSLPLRPPESGISLLVPGCARVHLGPNYVCSAGPSSRPPVNSAQWKPRAVLLPTKHVGHVGDFVNTTSGGSAPTTGNHACPTVATAPRYSLQGTCPGLSFHPTPFLCRSPNPRALGHAGTADRP